MKAERRRQAEAAANPPVDPATLPIEVKFAFTKLAYGRGKPVTVERYDHSFPQDTPFRTVLRDVLDTIEQEHLTDENGQFASIDQDVEEVVTVLSS